LKSWKNFLEMENKVTRLMMIGRIFENNSKLYKLIRNQIYLLEKYEDDMKDVMPIKDYIEGYKELLNLVGLTGGTFDDEWDDETGRKS
jgi:hypothetical protein